MKWWLEDVLERLSWEIVLKFLLNEVLEWCFFEIVMKWWWKCREGCRVMMMMMGRWARPTLTISYIYIYIIYIYIYIIYIYIYIIYIIYIYHIYIYIIYIYIIYISYIYISYMSYIYISYIYIYQIYIIYISYISGGGGRPPQATSGGRGRKSRQTQREERPWPSPGYTYTQSRHTNVLTENQNLTKAGITSGGCGIDECVRLQALHSDEQHSMIDMTAWMTEPETLHHRPGSVTPEVTDFARDPTAARLGCWHSF